MAHLIHVWHERNCWSHKVLPALVETLDLGRVHSSQISNLRNGKLGSPSPEVFLALAQANLVLFEGIESIQDQVAEVHPELLKVLKCSASPLINDNGLPLKAGELFEIFLGLAPLPSSFNWFIEDEEAVELSAALADYLCGGQPWRNCRDQVMSAYPINKIERRERFAEVMAGIKDYTAEELDGELIELNSTHIALTGKTKQGANEFLQQLRIRVKILKS